MSQAAPGNVLLSLAVEAVLPALAGCAEVLRGGVTTAGLVERGLNLFGKQIAARWYAWSRGQDDEARRAALNDLAALSQEEARRQAADGLTRLAPDARPQDRIAASAYLAAIPRTLDRVWRDEEPTRVWSPGTVSWEEPNGLLAALPADAPPYDPPCDLPSSPYRLEQLLGAGGFGAVYRAAAASLQHLPFAVKFCLDPALAPALHQERANLERLMKAGRDPGALRVVRLYGYDLAHATPYLVYEYVPGGDLDRHVRGRRRLHGRSLRPAEVLAIIRQVAEGLAFAHRHGLVHRDLKPGNILVDGQLLKLADFGLGAAAMARVARVAEAVAPQNGHEEGAATLRHSQFRAAGTPLYMSPEQREGAPPDPRHDIYSLGVMWHQLLADDLTRELQSGWAKDLSVRYAAPRGHLKLIERCVGPFDARPQDGGELCEILNIVAAEASATPPVLPPSMEVRPILLPAAPVVVTPVSPRPEPPHLPAEGPLLDRLVGQVRRVRRDLDDLPRPPTPPHVVLPPGPREECAKMLRRLLQAHRAAAHFLSPPNKAAAALIALGAACLFGWFAAALFRLVSQSQFNPTIALNGTFPWGAFAVGLVSAVAACALAVVAQQQLWHWRLQAAQEGVTSAAHRLADRFPDLVRVWGGVVVLHDAETVARLLRDVEPGE